MASAFSYLKCSTADSDSEGHPSMKIILNSTHKGKVFSKKRTWQLWEQNSSSEQMAGARVGGVGAGQVREDLTSKNKTVVVSPDQTCSTISTLKVTSLADKACMKPTCVCVFSQPGSAPQGWPTAPWILLGGDGSLQIPLR